MEYDKLKESLNNFRAEVADLRKKMLDLTKPFLQAGFKQYLVENPEIDKIFWTQCTPYFNDGDACEFAVHEVCIALKGDTDVRKYEESYIVNPRYEWAAEGNARLYGIFSEERIHELFAAHEEIKHMVDSIDEDIMKKLFGDHVRIEIYLKDDNVVIDVDEYDHD